MDLSKNTITGLSCLLIGLCLQFCLGNAMWSFLLGSLILMCGPAFGTSDYTKDFARPAKDAATTKWKTFDAETAARFIQELQIERVPPIRKKAGIDYLLTILGSLALRIIGVLVALLFFSDDNYGAAAIAIDIPFIPYGLFQIRYGVGPGEAFSNTALRSCRADRSKLETTSLLLSQSLRYAEFKMNGQLEIEHGTRNIVTDAKMSIRYTERYRDLLCGMISISMNRVQSRVFPYAYYVIVVKGQDKSRLPLALSDVVANTVFSIERNFQDGNTVYVMTKQAGVKYHTDINDLHVLLDIVARSTYAMRDCLGVEA